ILDAGTKAPPQTVRIPVADDASGVLRVTVFDRQLQPVAERLVQRDAVRGLKVTLAPATERIVPGSRQKIAVHVADESGAPVSCLVGMSVFDRAVGDMLHEHSHTGLVDHQRLWTDVERPDEKVDEFQDRSGEHHARNVDLLLGCLGWRRYVWRGDLPEATLVAGG